MQHGLVTLCFSFMTSSKETDRAYSFNRGAHTRPGTMENAGWQINGKVYCTKTTHRQALVSLSYSVEPVSG